MQIVGSELARDSEVKIACKQASYTDHLMTSLSTSQVEIHWEEPTALFRLELPAAWPAAIYCHLSVLFWPL